MSTIFLIIPESEWKNVRSDLGASGYFQFTYSTAKGYGLITKESDLRSDIYSASRAAAKYLIKMYLLFNRDYDLMLAAYNSGMPLKYRLQAIGDGQLVSYQGYLNYLREKMDSELEKLREGMVKVRSGMSVHRILKSFGIEPNKENIEIFSKHNRLRNGNLLAGTVVTVPPSLMTEETQVSLRSMATARYIRENLNYPPKFYAALDSIELHFPGFVAFANGTKTYEELLAIAKVDGLKMPTENPPAQVVDGVKYTVKSGDTMWGILLAHGVNPTKKNIRTISGGHSNLSIGQKLTIPRELITPSSDRKPVPKPRPRRGKMAAVIKYNH
jgi:LysM repeat protein